MEEVRIPFQEEAMEAMEAVALEAVALEVEAEADFRSNRNRIRIHVRHQECRQECRGQMLTKCSACSSVAMEVVAAPWGE